MLDYAKFQKRNEKYSRANFEKYFMELGPDRYIDATNHGNISRYINHSCDPNAEMSKWIVNGLLRIGIFSKQNIAKGEEISIDYKYEQQHPQKCYCGSNVCQGWL